MSVNNTAGQQPEEDDFPDEPQGKRSWFAPIVLVLLVLSLIGNVYYISVQLQADKKARMDDGRSIITSAVLMKEQLHHLIELARQIETEGDTAKRAETAYLLGKSEYYLGSYYRLFALADSRGDKLGIIEDRNNPAAILEEAIYLLARLTQGGLPLSDNENQYLNEQLLPLLEAAKAEADRFVWDQPGGISDLMALQTAVGGSWVETTARLAEALRANKPEPWMGS